jgi:hypothetical protein
MAGRGGATRSDWSRSRAVALLVGVVVALGCVAALLTPPGATTGRATTARRGLTSLPLTAQGPVSAALGHDEPAYRVTALQAVNPAQHLRASFSRAGVTVASGKARLGMELSAYGYASALEPVGFAQPRAGANRVSYAHGALTEWYANGPLGIEQGFDIAARPGAATGPLTLSLALSGNLAARLRHGSVLLTSRGAALRYGGLFATDARGRVLRSWLQLVKGHVLIRVADRGATYPLRIDPLVQQGEKLTGTGQTGNGYFGYSVALSADANTALIGGDQDNGGVGSAWVFTRSGSTWTRQSSKLTGAGESYLGKFGSGVAISEDGATTLIGGPADNGAGAVWAYVSLQISVPTELSFGSQAVGQEGPVLWLSVQNTGQSPLTFSGEAAQIGGTDAGDFKIPSGDDLCEDTTLDPGQACRIGVQFMAVAGGARSATLSFDTGNSRFLAPAVSLTGTGVAESSQPAGNGNTTSGTGNVESSAGTQGSVGSVVTPGATVTPGSAGSPGEAGKVELLTCKPLKGGQRCTAKFVNGRVKLEAARPAARAALSRRGRVVATGTVRTVDGHMEFLSSDAHTLPRGRFTLTITRKAGRHTIVTREAITIT